MRLVEIEMIEGEDMLGKLFQVHMNKPLLTHNHNCNLGKCF